MIYNPVTVAHVLVILNDMHCFVCDNKSLCFRGDNLEKSGFLYRVSIHCKYKLFVKVHKALNLPSHERYQKGQKDPNISKPSFKQNGKK